MHPASLFKLGLLFIAVIASAFFSGAESALFSLGFHRVRRLKDRSPQSFQIAQRLLREPTKLISTILVGNELVNTTIGVVGSSLVYDFAKGKVPDSYLAPLAIVSVLPFVVIFGEIVPKTLGMKAPELIAAYVSVPLEWFSNLITPFRNGLSWISEKVLTLTGAQPKNPATVSEEVFRAMVDAGTEEGVLDSYEQQLIHNVFRLDDIQVQQIMAQKKDVSFLTQEMMVKDAMKKFEADRYSRFPVLSIDHKEVVGVIYVKDLLPNPKIRETSWIEPYMRKPLIVPPTMNALDLFVHFRSRRTHFAVVSEATSGQMIGVVTLDDVLKEIFGRIRDERDIEEEPSKRS